MKVLLLLIHLITIGSLCHAAKFQVSFACTNGGSCSTECAKRSSSVQTCTQVAGDCQPPSILPVQLIFSKCFCQCHSDCKFEDDIIKSKSSICGSDGKGVDKLRKVDDEIFRQMAFNTMQAIGGAIPVVGPLIDIGFGLYSPVSFVTSPFQLANDVRAAMNDAIAQLQQCMDDKISDAKVDDTKDKQNGILSLYQSTKGAKGKVKLDWLFATFVKFNTEIPEIFARAESNHIEYWGMLPVFKTLYPLFGTVATERLLHLKYNQSDEVNFGSERGKVVALYDLLNTWIVWAKTSIVANLNTKLSAAQCRNEAAMKQLLNEWETDFVQTNIVNLARYKQQFLTIPPTPSPTPAPLTPTNPPVPTAPLPPHLGGGSSGNLNL